MNIFDSYVDAGQQLGQRDKEQFYTALLEFAAYGTEPRLKGPALAVFTAIRPSLELSKQRASSGRKGGRRKAEADGDLAAKQNASKGRANAEASTEANGQAKGKSKSKKEEEPPIGGSKKAPARFEKPTVSQVAGYAAGIGSPSFDAARFVDYYESNGWKVGRSPMRDWEAAVRNWARKDAPQAKGGEYHAEYD